MNIDVRVVAATHRDLEEAVRSGKFRQDLFFRLNGALLKLPPLRERPQDISILCKHFLEKAGSQAHFDPEALELLERHSWPGNVRELEQVVTRAALLTEGEKIGAPELELGSANILSDVFGASGILGAAGASGFGAFLTLEEAQSSFTRDFVQKSLQQNQGNRTKTSRSLGVSERTLYRLLAEAEPDRIDR